MQASGPGLRAMRWLVGGHQVSIHVMFKNEAGWVEPLSFIPSISQSALVPAPISTPSADSNENKIGEEVSGWEERIAHQ